MDSWIARADSRFRGKPRHKAGIVERSSLTQTRPGSPFFATGRMTFQFERPNRLLSLPEMECVLDIAASSITCVNRDGPGQRWGQHSRLLPKLGCLRGKPFATAECATLSQQKILEEELALTSRERAAASLARNLAFNHFGTNLYSNYSIERMAVWTNE